MRTDHAHTQARITQIDGDRLRRALDAGEIAVVAGFQGISHEDEITTLGRGRLRPHRGLRWRPR
jgi:aspartate kinase